MEKQQQIINTIVRSDRLFEVCLFLFSIQLSQSQLFRNIFIYEVEWHYQEEYLKKRVCNDNNNNNKQMTT